MALKFRRGTTAQKSGSLAFGEPYVNTTLGTLQIGGESGDITLLINSASQGISGSSLNITGNAKIDGNLTLGGNITIGDQTSDTVTVTANLSSSLIPSVTNAFDLGSPTKIWKDLYLSTASIKLVDGNGNIVNTITNENIVTTDSIASGSITLTNSLPAGTVSGSAQVVGILSSLNSYTGSNDTLNTLQTTRIDQLASSTASVNSKISQLETDSGSQNTRITTLESKASTLQTYTASVDSHIFNLNIKTGSYATTGSNTFDGLQHINGELEIHSGSNPQIRLINTTTGIEYHIQNGDSGNFQIHNGTTGNLLFKFISASVAYGNQDAQYYSNLYVSKSVIADRLVANSITGSIYSTNGVVSGSSQVIGILSSLNTYTASNDTTNTTQNNKLSRLEESTASLNAFSASNGNTSLNSFTSSINTTIKSKLDTDGVISGSSQVTLASTTGFTSYSSSVDTRILTEKGRVDAILLASDADKDSFAEIVSLINSVDTTNDNTFASFYTASVNRLNNLESTSGSSNISISNINSFTSSINTTIKEKLNVETVVSSSAQVVGILAALNTYTASNDTTNNTQNSRLDQLSTDSGSQNTRITTLESKATTLGTYTASIDGHISDINTWSGSAKTSITNLETKATTLQTYTASVNGHITDINAYTASNTTTNNTQNSRLDQLSTASGSAISRLTALEGETLNLELYTGSFATASVTLSNKTISGASNTLSNIGNSSLTNSSITIAGQSTALGGTITAETIRTAIGTVVTGSSQINFTGLSGISANIISASSDTSNVDMIINGGSISANLYGGVVSGSAQVVGMLASLNTYTASNDTTNTNQSNKLSRLEESTASLNAYTASNNTKWSTLGSLSGSFARIDSANTFVGNQTITGSLFISADLIVAGSSSIQNISSSRLDIGDNIIQLNVNNPSLRFGGLAIYDSGSAGNSGSFLYDSLHDEFIFVHKGNGLNVTSSHFVLGPETYDNLGTETYLTNNRVPKGSGKEHLNDSNITDTGTLITLGSNSVVNGTFYATGTTLVSGSSQISHDSTTGYSANKHIDHTAVSITAGSGLSGGGDISATRTLSIATGGVTDSMLAGSISNAKLTNSSITIAGQSTALGSSVTAETIRTAIGTVVTGSSQIDLTATTNYASGILTRLNVVGVFSGSSQVSHDSTTGYSANKHIDHTSVTLTAGSGLTGGGDISTNRTFAVGAGSYITVNADDVAVNTTTLIPAISGTILSSITGDVTITAGGVATIAANSVALGTDTTGNYVASLVAGTNITLSNNSGEGATPTIGLTNNAITIAGQSTSLGGSVTAETIRTAIGTVVTGSAQIAIASTSGFGTYINQAVLTTSSPTFAGLTINGSITATGDITAYYTSDKRHKNNIQIIPNALQKVSKLNGVTWEWNDDVNEVTKSTPKTGLIAQEVQEVLPEVVKEREDGFLSLDYSKMTGLLVEAIKEQQSQIHKLTLEIENLKKQKGL